MGRPRHYVLDLYVGVCVRACVRESPVEKFSDHIAVDI